MELPKAQNLENEEIPHPENLCLLQLAITLRSPLESKILTQVRQPLSDQVLPLTFSTSIDVPIEDESNLILAEISLYGAFDGISEARLLATQFFTITADITQLLSITSPTENITPDISNQNTVPKTLPSDTREPEVSVNLGLELFNLVKTSQKIQFQPSIPIPNQPLPPQIHPRILVSTFDHSTDARWLELPKLPVSQPDSVVDDVVTQSPAIKESPAIEESVDNHLTIPTINMEQLLIKPRRSIANSAFPYLRRVKGLSSDKTKIHPRTPKLFELPAPITNQNKNVAELVTSEAEPVNESVVEEVSVVNTELNESIVEEVSVVTTELNESIVEEVSAPPPKLIIPPQPPSPLLKKWIHTQGYSLSESTDTNYEDTGNHLPIQPPLLAETTDKTIEDVDLPLNLHPDIPTEDAAISVDLPLNLNQDLNQDLETGIDIDLSLNANEEIATEAVCYRRGFVLKTKSGDWDTRDCH